MEKSVKAGMPTPSRQAAYLARKKAALVKAGQEVLALSGPNATIEQLATHAQVSTTTIYKYFENKDALFSEALGQMWRDWLIWAYDGVTPGQSLEAAISTARKLFWLRETHPEFAKVLANSLPQPAFFIAAVKQDGQDAFREFAKGGVLPEADFEKRVLLFANGLTGLLNAVYVSGELTPREAETALAIGLSVWGISETKAKKMLGLE